MPMYSYHLLGGIMVVRFPLVAGFLLCSAFVPVGATPERAIQDIDESATPGLGLFVNGLRFSGERGLEYRPGYAWTTERPLNTHVVLSAGRNYVMLATSLDGTHVTSRYLDVEAGSELFRHGLRQESGEYILREIAASTYQNNRNYFGTRCDIGCHTWPASEPGGWSFYFWNVPACDLWTGRCVTDWELVSPTGTQIASLHVEFRGCGRFIGPCVFEKARMAGAESTVRGGDPPVPNPYTEPSPEYTSDVEQGYTLQNVASSFTEDAQITTKVCRARTNDVKAQATVGKAQNSYSAGATYSYQTSFCMTFNVEGIRQTAVFHRDWFRRDSYYEDGSTKVYLLNPSHSPYFEDYSFKTPPYRIRTKPSSQIFTPEFNGAARSVQFEFREATSMSAIAHAGWFVPAFGVSGGVQITTTSGGSEENVVQIRLNVPAGHHKYAIACSAGNPNDVSNPTCMFPNVWKLY